MVYILLTLFQTVFSVTVNKLEKPNSDLDPAKMYFLNWSTCDEFLNNTSLNISDIVDVDWKIFYYWNHDLDDSYIVRFSVPSPTLVERFKVEVGKDVEPPVIWDGAEVFMETAIDFSALYIKTQKSGLYRLLPSFAFQLEKVPLLHFAIKYIKPEGYLGIMNCRQRMAYALAPNDDMPSLKKMETAASKIGFRSEWGRSIGQIHPGGYTPPPMHEYRELDDGDDDQQVLAKEVRYLPRMLREAIEIKKHPNFNREDGFSVPPVWDPVFPLMRNPKQT